MPVHVAGEFLLALGPMGHHSLRSILTILVGDHLPARTS
ncbi:hypothetical protein Poly30_27880 [Planctomycetes bacterium Poly30]|uniref:Uncharacterized protein n=1 Tax=Saltatorellus ferox TaxID=2528018 RepID=A0A518ET57_9BACT|nr:hypothetical protein Poly30_27880 [Planctomycetes bacterium Poly30]